MVWLAARCPQEEGQEINGEDVGEQRDVLFDEPRRARLGTYIGLDQHVAGAHEAFRKVVHCGKLAEAPRPVLGPHAGVHALTPDDQPPRVGGLRRNRELNERLRPARVHWEVSVNDQDWLPAGEVALEEAAVRVRLWRRRR